MDSLILILGLIGIIVFVRYDQMLFAVITGFFLIAYLMIKGFGRAGSALKSPIQAIKEDLSAEVDDIEKAPGSPPSGKDLKEIYDNFVDFSVKERKVEKETLAQISKGAEKLSEGAKKVFKK